MKSKAQLMRESRQRLEERGLISVQVQIPPDTRPRLEKYVKNYLNGVVPQQRRKTHKK